MGMEVFRVGKTGEGSEESVLLLAQLYKDIAGDDEW